MSILRKTLILFSVAGTLISVGYYRSAQPILLSVANAQEALEETEAQRLVREEVNEKRAELKGAFAEERAQFAEQLENIENKERREAALRFADSINETNKRATDHYLDVVGRMDAILQAMIIRIQDAGAKGADIESVWPKVQEARAQIGIARGAVFAQVGVIYNIEGSEEEVLLSEMQKTRTFLYDSLKGARDEVQKARNAIADSIRLFNELNRQ
jgi:hypothetical protein